MMEIKTSRSHSLERLKEKRGLMHKNECGIRFNFTHSHFFTSVAQQLSMSAGIVRDRSQ
jgi:hypothetical protein